MGFIFIHEVNYGSPLNKWWKMKEFLSHLLIMIFSYLYILAYEYAVKLWVFELYCSVETILTRNKGNVCLTMNFLSKNQIRTTEIVVSGEIQGVHDSNQAIDLHCIIMTHGLEAVLVEINWAIIDLYHRTRIMAARIPRRPQLGWTRN